MLNLQKPIAWSDVSRFCEEADADKANRCAKCDCVLQEIVSGRRKLGDKYVCSGCYFDDLSNFVEESPIQAPRVRRG
jgi:hypothetical protein